jgi:hypothetical protein
VFIRAHQGDNYLFLSQFIFDPVCVHPGTSQRDTRLFLSQFVLGPVCVHPGTSQRNTRLFLSKFVLGPVCVHPDTSQGGTRLFFFQSLVPYGGTLPNLQPDIETRLYCAETLTLTLPKTRPRSRVSTTQPTTILCV